MLHILAETLPRLFEKLGGETFSVNLRHKSLSAVDFCKRHASVEADVFANETKVFEVTTAFPFNRVGFSELDFLPTTVSHLPFLSTCCSPDTSERHSTSVLQAAVAINEFGPSLRIWSTDTGEQFPTSVSQATTAMNVPGTSGYITIYQHFHAHSTVSGQCRRRRRKTSEMLIESLFKAPL
jgi:hypothetical protein